MNAYKFAFMPLADEFVLEDLMFGDDVMLTDLTTLFPTWTPPPDAATLLADGDLLALWDDILFDVYAIA